MSLYRQETIKFCKAVHKLYNGNHGNINDSHMYSYQSGLELTGMTVNMTEFDSVIKS